MNANRFQVIEVSDSLDFCECCGKKGLKRVVFIRDTETDELKHFGTTCAVSPVKGFNVELEVKEAIARATSYAKCLASIAHAEYRKAGGKYVNKGDFTMTAADVVLWASTRAAVIARGFNF